MTELIEQIERLARKFAASGATAGTMQLHNSGRSGSYGTSYRDVVGALVPVSPDTAVISAAVRAESVVDAADPVRMRLFGDSYEFQYCCKSQHYYVFEWESARQVVLDPAYRYPGHAIPVPLTDAAPDDRPTDPELVATVDWEVLARSWGKEFPPDYQQFIELYGAGTIQNFLVMVAPEPKGRPHRHLDRTGTRT